MSTLEISSWDGKPRKFYNWKMAAVCDGCSFVGAASTEPLRNLWLCCKPLVFQSWHCHSEPLTPAGSCCLDGSRWKCRLFREAKCLQGKECNNGALLQCSSEELGTSGLREQAQKKLVIPQEERVEWRGFAELTLCLHSLFLHSKGAGTLHNVASATLVSFPEMYSHSVLLSATTSSNDPGKSVRVGFTWFDLGIMKVYLRLS